MIVLHLDDDLCHCIAHQSSNLYTNLTSVPRSGVHIYSFAGCIEITHKTSSLIHNSHIDCKNQMSCAYVKVAPSTEGRIQ